MKRLFQSALRRYHWRFCRRPLPDRLAVYFHTLDTDEHARFSEAMEWIQAQGYHFVRPGGFLSAEGKVCYVSFDDNFKAWHDAVPLLDRLGVRAAFFINTCVLRGECSTEERERFCKIINYRRDFVPLSRQDILEMHQAGHWIGAHTHGHIMLSKVSAQEAEDDLRRNRDILQEITGSPVTDMAFTFGLPRHFSPTAREVCVKLGFKTISWATPGMLHHQGDPLAIHRTQWNFALSAEENVMNLGVDGRTFVKLTGRSPIG